MSNHDKLSFPCTRRSVLKLALAAAATPSTVFADSGYPSKPIRIIVGFVPGGSIDFGARLAAAGLKKAIGANVIVENKSGATGIIATQYVARAPADGYTLLVGTATPIVIAPQAMRLEGFNPLSDLVAVNSVAESPMAIAVNPRVGVKDLKGLIALSKTRTITVGTSGLGGLLHLMVEELKEKTGGKFQVVPYKGTGPALADVLAGTVDACVSDVGAFIPLHNAGKLIVLGVATDHRLEQLPNVPTTAEELPGYSFLSWTGVFAPAGTPKDIVDTVSSALKKVATLPDIKTAFANAGARAYAFDDAAAFQKVVAGDYQRFGKVIKDNNIVIK